MADTGEDREIKQRIAAHLSETVRQSNQLEQQIKRAGGKKKARRNKRNARRARS